MADRSTFPVLGLKSDMTLCTGRLTGAGAADMVNAESSSMGAGEIVTAARTGTGAFTLTFRKRYPQLKSLFRPMIVGTTAGLQVRALTWNVQTQTATIVCEVGAVATDPAAADTIHFQWLVRNSSQNT